MDAWLEDLVEQLCVSEIFIDAKIDSGKRIAMILIDNAIEYMFKVYGDTKLVGSVPLQGPDPKLVGKKLSKTDWDSIKDKRNFHVLMDWVLPNSGSTVKNSAVSPYHETRNTLYHQALPLSVEPKKVLKYLTVARQLLEELFGVHMEDIEWNAKKEEVRGAFLLRPPVKPVGFSATDDGLIRVEAPGIRLTDNEVIVLCIFGLTRQLGRVPTIEELSRSINYSGRPVENLSIRIWQLRSESYITKEELALKAKARNSLIERFSLG